jgi:YhcH/YjgK/YiaL family protein
MIIDRLESAERYAGSHPGFRAAFDFLRRSDLASAAEGRTDIDGDRVYALVMDAAGKGRDAAKLETHRRYVDVQYVVAGCDVMGWRSAADPLQGEGYDAAKDIEFHRARPVCWFDVPQGHFAVFFPSDAHAPLACAAKVRKVVVKILAGA